MNFKKCVEYLPCWQRTKQIWQEYFRVQIAFHFLDLEQGCLLIAFCEALFSFVKICWIYYLVYRSDTRSLFPDPKWIYFMFRGKSHFSCYHHTHYQFHVGRYLISILNSMLLLLGVKWDCVAFLYYWIYISLFTWVMSLCNTLFDNFEHTLIFHVILLAFLLEFYLILIVTSLICEISEKSKYSVDEVEEEPDFELVE